MREKKEKKRKLKYLKENEGNLPQGHMYWSSTKDKIFYSFAMDRWHELSKHNKHDI